MAVKQTAGRNALGEFAPKFAQLNDDVLFGEVWSREDKLSLRDRSLVTVVALMAQGLVDSSFKYHLTMQDGRKHGQHFIWQKRCGRKNVTAMRLIMQERPMKIPWFSRSVSPMMVLHSILLDRVIWRQSRQIRRGSLTSPLSRAVGITGISTMGTKAADRSWSAWQDEDITRKKEKRHGNFIQEM